MPRKPFVKALGWCGCMLLFGLLQFWSILGHAALDENVSFDSKKFLLDCGLVFFSTALVASFAIDFFCQKRKLVKNLALIGALYALYPALIMGLAIWIYSVCFLGNPDLELLFNMQLVIIFMSILYALVLKTMHFANKKG